jgi:hypothetical protein
MSHRESQKSESLTKRHTWGQVEQLLAPLLPHVIILVFRGKVADQHHHALDFLGHLVHKGLQRGDDACMKIGLVPRGSLPSFYCEFAVAGGAGCRRCRSPKTKRSKGWDGMEHRIKVQTGSVAEDKKKHGMGWDGT